MRLRDQKHQKAAIPWDIKSLLMTGVETRCV